MEPLSTFTSAITSVKTAIEIAHMLNSTDQEIQKANFRIQIAELMNSLADTKEYLFKLKEIINNQNDEILLLDSQLKSLNDEEKMVYQANAYYTKDGDGPYCTICFDINKDKIRLVEMPKSAHEFGKRKCPLCKTKYQ
jgi:hypothetical protein